MSWTRLTDGHHCGASWEHDSGWRVQHCGHPTSNWPYYLVDPKTHRTVLAQNGHGFRTLALAKNAVLAILSGYYRVERGQVLAPGE
jgi:hypothetical protein